MKLWEVLKLLDEGKMEDRKFRLIHWGNNEYIWMGKDFYNKDCVMTNRITRMKYAITEPYMPIQQDMVSNNWVEVEN